MNCPQTFDKSIIWRRKLNNKGVASIQHQCPVLCTGWQRSYWFKVDLMVRIQATETHRCCLYWLCLCWLMHLDTLSNTQIVFDFWWCLEPYHTASQCWLKTYMETAPDTYSLQNIYENSRFYMCTISVNCELVPRMSTGPILGYRTAIESESLNVLADVINVMQSYCMIILKFDRSH